MGSSKEKLQDGEQQTRVHGTLVSKSGEKSIQSDQAATRIGRTRKEVFSGGGNRTDKRSDRFNHLENRVKEIFVVFRCPEQRTK